MKVGNAGARALIDLVRGQLEGTQACVSRAQVLDLPDGGGALLVVWSGSPSAPAASGEVPRSVGGDLSPTLGVSCPSCRGTPVGIEDGDGELTCLACGHEWHDDRFDDSKG